MNNMGDATLEAATEEKLKFDKHTEAQVNKANKVLGLLRRSFETLDWETSETASRMYCNAVTYPVYEKDAKLLEGVQRRATKMVSEMKNDDYANRLKKLALPSLS